MAYFLHDSLCCWRQALVRQALEITNVALLRFIIIVNIMNEMTFLIFHLFWYIVFLYWMSQFSNQSNRGYTLSRTAKFCPKIIFALLVQGEINQLCKFWVTFRLTNDKTQHTQNSSDVIMSNFFCRFQKAKKPNRCWLISSKNDHCGYRNKEKTTTTNGSFKGCNCIKLKCKQRAHSIQNGLGWEIFGFCLLSL